MTTDNAAPQPEAREGVEEHAWLIEMASTSPSAPLYLEAISSDKGLRFDDVEDNGLVGRIYVEWTRDAFKALRLARQEDAERVTAAKIIPTATRVCDHLFTAPPAPQKAEAPEPVKPVAWRMEINHGPDGEQNWTNVFDETGALVGNFKTHHAIAIVARLAAPAPGWNEADLARALEPELFSDDATVAHRAASPVNVDQARTNVLAHAREVIARLNLSRPSGESPPLSPGERVRVTSDLREIRRHAGHYGSLREDMDAISHIVNALLASLGGGE